MVRRVVFVLALAACDAESETSTDAAIGAGDDAASDASGGSDAPGGNGEPANLAGITQLHNEVRAMVQTSPALTPLTWDDGLAATAAAWVAQCRDQDAPMGLIDHNPDRGKGHSFSVGENIFASTGNASAEGAVDSWASERADYDYGQNSCAANKQCGHYTQLVWRSTEKVGCAIGRCPNLTFSSTIVCDYGPAGNFNGQRPY